VFSLAEKSLYVEAIDLWIDSMRSRDRCYISHGHSDHAREHTLAIATPRTARICRARFEAPVPFDEHAFNEPWLLGDHRLTLFSAGHVLGSSQLLIENERGRFVYTGDFKLQHSLTAEPPEVKPCDVVLMECTYGSPQYAFPPRDEVEGEMIAFARGALEAGAVPVFFAYSLGKAQEAVAILGNAGLALTAHPAIADMCEVYRECGVQLPPYKAYGGHTFDPQSVLIWPPSNRSVRKALRGKLAFTAILTGWTLDRGAIFRYGANCGFALSDHADYPALLRYVELAQPKKVLLNHGRRDFVYRLRAIGVNAEYLEEHEQLALF
jgi:Cft2 family RNA processing exonuclease